MKDTRVITMISAYPFIETAIGRLSISKGHPRQARRPYNSVNQCTTGGDKSVVSHVGRGADFNQKAMI